MDFKVKAMDNETNEEGKTDVEEVSKSEHIHLIHNGKLDLREELTDTNEDIFVDVAVNNINNNESIAVDEKLTEYMDKAMDNDTFLGDSDEDQKPAGWCDRLRSDVLYRCKLLHTVCTTWAMVSSGMSHIMIGLAFPDLMVIIQQDLAQSSWIFTAWSFGNMIGSPLAGYTYDRFNKLAVLMALSTGLSATTGATPWCTNYVVMLVIHFIGGGFASAIHSVVTADTILLWKHEKATYLQIVHLAAAIGGIFSPFFVNPFLSKRSDDAAYTIPHNITVTVGAVDEQHVANEGSTYNSYSTISYGRHSSSGNYIENGMVDYRMPNVPKLYLPNGTETFGSQNKSALVNLFINHLSNPQLTNNVTSTQPIYTGTRIHYAYLIGCCFTFVAVVLYILVYISHGNPHKLQSENTNRVHNNESTTDSKGTLSRKLILMFVLLVAAQIMVYVTIQRHMYGLFTTYAVKHLNWTNDKSSNIMSAFWSLFCLGRLVAVFVSRKFQENTLNHAFNVITSLGMLVFVISSHLRHSVLIIISLLASAFGMSPLFTYMLSWCSTFITPVTGRVTGVVYVFMAIGSMSAPVISGHLMNHVSYEWYVYLLLILLVVYLFLTVIIRFLYGKISRNNRGMIQ